MCKYSIRLIVEANNILNEEYIWVNLMRVGHLVYLTHVPKSELVIRSSTTVPSVILPHYCRLYRKTFIFEAHTDSLVIAFDVFVA